MSFNISKRRTSSNVPYVSQYNNWFTSSQKKPSPLQVQGSKLLPSYYSSTLSVNPQSSQIKDSTQPRSMRRTFSAFKNTQSRMSGLKDDVFDLLQEAKRLVEKNKSMKLSFDMMKQQLNAELKQTEQSQKHNLNSLNKLVKSTIKSNQLRTQQIKQDTIQLKQSSDLIKKQIAELHERVSYIQHQCGFMTFASKLMH